MEEADIALRLVLISAERLHRMANARANKEAILAELDCLQKRVGDATVAAEKTPMWILSEGILPK